LEPADAVSTIDTDIECILAESLADARARTHAETAAAEAAAASEAAAAAAALDEIERVAAAAAAVLSLPPEPPLTSSGEGIVECSLRLPGGLRAARRFRVNEPLAVLFAFVDTLEGRPASGNFQLVRRAPRRVMVRPSSEAELLTTLAAAGLVAGREALIVEPI
jgi:hypothetical protein